MILVSGSVASQAADYYTQYSFWFRTIGGYKTIGATTVDAYVNWDGSSVIGGGGSVYSSFNPSWNGASMTNYGGSSLNVLTFQLSSTGGIIYTADFTANKISWTQEGMKAEYGFIGAISPTGTKYGTVPAEVINGLPAPVQVPEIDGENLPQVALLIGGLFLAYRSRKFLKLPSVGMVQSV